MCICADLAGPKIENMHATAGRSKFLKGQMRGDTVKLRKSQPEATDAAQEHFDRSSAGAEHSRERGAGRVTSLQHRRRTNKAKVHTW